MYFLIDWFSLLILHIYLFIFGGGGEYKWCYEENSIHIAVKLYPPKGYQVYHT